MPAAEERLERVFEVPFDLLKRHAELLLRGLVDLVDGFEQIGFGAGEIVALRFEKIVALLEIGVFLDGHEVHRAHADEALAERVDLGLDRIPKRGFQRLEVILGRLRLLPNF